ncbi:uncharacterized protein LOC118647214 isoform X2 [Monomorium pharaonis]|uniref:uncharacterized protein LOC118647214 isoform X2 n=1 Tax=Monomorium pharaonis TaxID=307658 RepID=UPI001745CD2A|nr:uncharacterized protein LOC118647214 isoform X2 [Monomorium pharaonis]
MDNNKCLLLEFVNEDKKIAVGYEDWLQNKINDEEKYLNIFKNKNEIEIKWPDCDIAPASIMKKRVRTCDWKIVAAKILFFGEWTKMCEQRDNLETYGVLEPTKGQRKSMCKKQWSDDEKENSQNKKKYKKSGIKRGTTETKSSKLWTEVKIMKNIDCGQSSDDDSSSKMSQHLIQENDTLKKENDDLKKENMALRISLSCIENLPRINNLVENILLKTEKLNDKVDFTDFKKSKNEINTTNNILEMESNKESNNEKMIDLGETGVLVSASRLRNCNRNSISQYTCDLLSVVFSKEELASCSLTGKIANTMKGANITPKERLNPKRHEAIEAHACVFNI